MAVLFEPTPLPSAGQIGGVDAQILSHMISCKTVVSHAKAEIEAKTRKRVGLTERNCFLRFGNWRLVPLNESRGQS